MLLFQMQIIFSDEGLMDIEPPCVAQTFINHNAILYKVMVINESVFVLDRPSIKNFAPDIPRKTIRFDSQDVSKASSSSYLNEVSKCVRVFSILLLKIIPIYWFVDKTQRPSLKKKIVLLVLRDKPRKVQ